MESLLRYFMDLSNEQRMAVFRRGYRVEPASLADQDYRGVSLGLPKWVERLTWTKFRKAFRLKGGTVKGWNIRLRQNGLTQSDEALSTFGHFNVQAVHQTWLPASKGHRGRRYDGLLLNYSVERGPMRFVRDPLVSLQPNTTEWLLGWTFLDFGVVRVATPSFFVLQRVEALSQLSSSYSSRQ